MHDALTIKLLNKLGLRYGPENSTDPEVLATRRKFYKFLKLNIDRPTDEFNKELAEMIVMAKQARKKANDFLSANGLTATELSTEWNEHFMCLEITLKIDGQPKSAAEDHYLSYEGRELQLRIMGKNSNNNFNQDDIRNMFEAKKRAAKSLNPNINVAVKHLEQQLNSIIAAFNTTKLPKTLEAVIALQQELICFLEVELIRQELKNPAYNPTAEQIRSKILDIESQETINLSKKRRAVNIVAYAQETSNDSDFSQWMLTLNIPKSDIPSDERGLKVHRVPNAWDVTQSVYQLKKGKVESIVKHAEAYRSASIAQLSELEIKRGSRSDETKNLCNLIIETARDQLLERLNNHEDIDFSQIFSIKTLYLTLLTPLIDKESSSRSLLINNLPKKVKDTLIKGNEDEQLLSLRTALEHIEDRTLEFSKLDREYIIEHLRVDVPDNIDQLLGGMQIKHDFFYSNFTVNTFKKFDLGKFKACVKNNEVHNADGIEYLNQHLLKFLQEHGFDLTSILSVGKEWPVIKNELITILRKIDPNNIIYKVLSLYIQLGDYFESQQDRKFTAKNVLTKEINRKENSMLVESYFAAAIEIQLASLLGFDIRTTCKSGKDRTGLFLAIVEASAGPPEKFRINLCRALKYSDIKELIEKNRTGCRGVQVDPDVMDGLKTYAGVALEGSPNEFRDLLESWESRAVGSIPKEVYNKNQAVIDAYIKKHPPTPISAAPIVINKAKPPAVPERHKTTAKPEPSENSSFQEKLAFFKERDSKSRGPNERL